MLIREFQAELIKEKRSSNEKLLFLTPIIFVSFSWLMSLLMGNNPVGKSNFIAAAFNWYPLLILPAILALLTGNIFSKEKSSHVITHQMRERSLNYLNLAKELLILMETFLLVLISGILLFLICKLTHQPTTLWSIMLASLGLFIGSLPILGFNLIVKNFLKMPLLIFVNFVLGILAVIVVDLKIWFLFPWSYNFKFMMLILNIRPNGTFMNHYAGLNSRAIIVLILAALLFYLISILGNWLINYYRRNLHA